MATLTNAERNTLRRAVRLLDMRENQGQEAYDQIADGCSAELREMMQPTEQYVLHVPEEFAFKAKVVWYEARPDGKKHLFLRIIEEGQPADTTPQETAADPTEGE